MLALPGSLLHALLITPVNSACTQKGAEFDACSSVFVRLVVMFWLRLVRRRALPFRRRSLHIVV